MALFFAAAPVSPSSFPSPAHSLRSRSDKKKKKEKKQASTLFAFLSLKSIPRMTYDPGVLQCQGCLDVVQTFELLHNHSGDGLVKDREKISKLDIDRVEVVLNGLLSSRGQAKPVGVSKGLARMPRKTPTLMHGQCMDETEDEVGVDDYISLWVLMTIYLYGPL
ncbi:uncharacterized protein LOC131165559 [Malania oleifera]|uniref:uncharacterized protein LOC131165559 n=1 Tax=Malania oleifera TaxID=397392 RepID=UPI0025ADDC41|nr:uncharacterized protein LOC131165559 [Malania oleifera]